MPARFDTKLPAAADLVLPCCRDCGRVNYPPRELCGACLGDALVWQQVDNLGVVQACTELHYSLEPDYAQQLPWRIASVALACGPIALAHLQPGVSEGAEVALRIVQDRHGNRMLAAVDPQQISRCRLAGRHPVQGVFIMRNVLLTGGSAGIGLTLCRELLSDGCTVINLSRRPAPLVHEHLHNYPVDLADTAATGETAVAVARQHAITDIVHNAGVIRPALLGSVELADLEMLNRIHLGAAITLTQAALPSLRRCGSGRIVLISSRAAMGMERRTSYSATKSGMVGMARTWALELAADGITVNVVAPGPIAETEMFDDAIQEEEKRQQIAASIPVGRLGTPADVARAVRFFLSQESSFITGQTLFVCGGASIGSLSL